jgi:hypothetical protein
MSKSPTFCASPKPGVLQRRGIKQGYIRTLRKARLYVRGWRLWNGAVAMLFASNFDNHFLRC